MLRRLLRAGGQICRNGKCRAIELIDKEAVAALELLRQCGDLICEGDCLLIDLQFLEHEGHWQAYAKMSSGSGEQETAGEQIRCELSQSLRLGRRC